MMEDSTQISWQRKIELVKEDFPDIHVFYSSTRDWAYVSWKSNRKRIDNTMTLDVISDIIAHMRK